MNSKEENSSDFCLDSSKNSASGLDCCALWDWPETVLQPVVSPPSSYLSVLNDFSLPRLHSANERITVTNKISIHKGTVSRDF